MLQTVVEFSLDYYFELLLLIAGLHAFANFYVNKLRTNRNADGDALLRAYVRIERSRARHDSKR